MIAQNTTQPLRLKAGVTTNGNIVATGAGGRHVLTTSGEYKTGDGLLFPASILDSNLTDADNDPATTPEDLLRRFAVVKAEEKAADQRADTIAGRQFSGSFREAAKRLETAHEWGNARAREFYDFKRSPRLLRLALKRAEKKAAVEKAAKMWATKCRKAAAKLLKSGPKCPLKGQGYERANFETGNNKRLQAVFAAIPANHKNEVGSRRFKGYFSWNAVISPEASKAMEKLINLAKS